MDLVASDWVIWSKRKACPTSSGKTDLGCTDIHARLRCQKKTKKQERKQHRMPQLKGNYIPSLVPITIRTPSVTTLSLGNMIPPETGEHQKKKNCQTKPPCLRAEGRSVARVVDEAVHSKERLSQSSSDQPVRLGPRKKKQTFRVSPWLLAHDGTSYPRSLFYIDHHTKGLFRCPSHRTFETTVPAPRNGRLLDGKYIVRGVS